MARQSETSKSGERKRMKMIKANFFKVYPYTAQPFRNGRASDGK
jgi:hypothetical protein